MHVMPETRMKEKGLGYCANTRSLVMDSVDIVGSSVRKVCQS